MLYMKSNVMYLDLVCTIEDTLHLYTCSANQPVQHIKYYLDTKCSHQSSGWMKYGFMVVYVLWEEDVQSGLSLKEWYSNPEHYSSKPRLAEKHVRTWHGSQQHGTTIAESHIRLLSYQTETSFWSYRNWKWIVEDQKYDVIIFQSSAATWLAECNNEKMVTQVLSFFIDIH